MKKSLPLWGALAFLLLAGCETTSDHGSVIAVCSSPTAGNNRVGRLRGIDSAVDVADQAADGEQDQGDWTALSRKHAIEVDRGQISPVSRYAPR